ncbi:16S rRNA (guanine(966)-N(2))-methyltransferase RsmD [Halomonas koreensis]|uniref:Ribosomal RNA small subunit methyltransferase D n=1 Tax=Halomonas koreensis TaxID=245385 RepID=A0ABU1G3Y3_9GAMM|nr:16S rRNA (guanine(966)-N(2))-methyltransferase RsmD [Halomonas koreensis]MDR5867154.1 16S rRNA (guanine(966)-N(2))-methyltransferase RsmD [Halomonas koreensis]
MSRRRPASRAPKKPARRPGQLRLIGGEHRRRRLPVLDSPGLRPTPDRVRETLFNWLSGVTPGARVLDLFAGTGALGLEALSRGAAGAVLVERDARVARALVDNLATLDITRAEVVVDDALRHLAGPPRAATLAFVDPPFRQGLAGPCCEALEAGWLDDEAWIYVETESELDPEVPAGWSLHREVRAGDSTGRLYRRRSTPGESPDGDAC